MSSPLEHEDDELGTVRLCNRCREEWPRDGEFWYFDRRGKVMGNCKACWAEMKRLARAPRGPDFTFRSWAAGTLRVIVR